MKHHLGQPVTRTFVTTQKTLYDIDEILENISTSTGLKVSRSRVLSLLLEIFSDSRKHLNVRKIHNENTLREAIEKAIAKYAEQAPERD